MYDYRLPRSTTRKKKRSIRTKTNQKLQRSRSTAKDGSVLARIGRALLFSLVAVGMLGVGLYFLASIVLPMVFPLERDTTVVFVPAGQQATDVIGVVTFKPSNSSVTGALVSLNDWPNPVPEDSSYESAAAWSQTLRLVVDQVIPTPVFSQLRHSQMVPTILWEDLRQTQILDWFSLQQTRLWVFARGVPSAQRRWLEVASPQQWERSKFQMVLGNQFTQCPVGVINTTSTSGLATRMSSLIEESGYPVVRLTDNRDNLEQSHIFVDADRPECLAEAQRLARLLPQEVVVTADSSVVRQYRAQIVLFLGQEVAVTE